MVAITVCGTALERASAERARLRTQPEDGACEFRGSERLGEKCVAGCRITKPQRLGGETGNVQDRERSTLAGESGDESYISAIQTDTAESWLYEGSDIPADKDPPRFDTNPERLMVLSTVTQRAVKESLRRLVVEQSLDDDDIVEEVYGSQAFRDGVATFTSGGKG